MRRSTVSQELGLLLLPPMRLERLTVECVLENTLGCLMQAIDNPILSFNPDIRLRWCGNGEAVGSHT